MHLLGRHGWVLMLSISRQGSDTLTQKKKGKGEKKKPSKGMIKRRNVAAHKFMQYKILSMSNLEVSEP